MPALLRSRTRRSSDCAVDCASRVLSGVQVHPERRARLEGDLPDPDALVLEHHVVAGWKHRWSASGVSSQAGVATGVRTVPIGTSRSRSMIVWTCARIASSEVVARSTGSPVGAQQS